MKKHFTYLLFLISVISFGQANKTFNDSIFKVDDIIRIPSIVYVLDGNGHENDTTFQKIADFINSHKNIVFEIDAHTDSRGRSKSNRNLSIRRSKSVKKELVSRFNVQSRRLKTKGYGSSKPLVTDLVLQSAKTKEEKESLHSKNRRTELKVKKIM